MTSLTSVLKFSTASHLLTRSKIRWLGTPLPAIDFHDPQPGSDSSQKLCAFMSNRRDQTEANQC